MAPVNPAAAGADKAIALCANDIGHLQWWPGHPFCSLSEGWILSITLESCRLSTLSPSHLPKDKHAVASAAPAASSKSPYH